MEKRIRLREDRNVTEGVESVVADIVVNETSAALKASIASLGVGRLVDVREWVMDRHPICCQNMSSNI